MKLKNFAIVSRQESVTNGFTEIRQAARISRVDAVGEEYHGTLAVWKQGDTRTRVARMAENGKWCAVGVSAFIIKPQPCMAGGSTGAVRQGHEPYSPTGYILCRGEDTRIA